MAFTICRFLTLVYYVLVWAPNIFVLGLGKCEWYYY
jgi:hypothetical protein